LLPAQEGAAVISAGLSIGEYGGYVVVALDGELDVSDAASVADALTSVAARDARIIVDLAALEFTGCCALGALGRVRARARQAGGGLLLAAPRGPVRRILALAGLIDVFSVRAGVADAVRVMPPLVHLARAGRRFPAWPWGRHGCHGVDLPPARCGRVRRFNPAFRPAWLMRRVACSLAGGRARLPSAAGRVVRSAGYARQGGGPAGHSSLVRGSWPCAC
jgi:anti-anti-sigma factor